MGVKSIATKGNKSEKKKEASSEFQTSEEDVNVQANGSTSSVDCSQERKDKKKKKKVKESVNRGNEEEQPEKLKKRKHGKEGNEVMVKNVEISSERERDGKDENEVVRNFAGLENDSIGDESAMEKKQKRKRESVSEDSVEKIEADGDREESKRKRKKSEKKRNGANGSVGVDEKMQTDKAGVQGKKSTETESENASGGSGSRVETEGEVVKSKKKKKTRSGSVADSMEDKAATDEEGDEEKKKKKLKSKGGSNGLEVEAKTYDEEGKSKKKKETKSGSISDVMGDKAETDEEAEKSTKKAKKKKKKERKSEDISSAGENQGKDDDLSKDGNEEARGEGEKGKAATENSIETSEASENLKRKKNSKRVSFSDNVEVFDDGPSKKVKSGDNDDEGTSLVQGKRFTPEEDEIVKDAVLKYIETHDLGENGLEMVLNCKSHREVKNCWKEISAALPQRPLTSVYYRAHILFERAEARKWTDEERAYVQEFYKLHGADWKKLASELKKHRFHCKDTWRRNKLLNRRKGRWKQEEYQNLFDLVNMDLRMRAYEERKSKHGMLRDNICWEAISDKLTTRNNSTCCSKWYMQLSSPMVAQGLWSDTDDYRLLGALSALDAPSLDDVDWDDLLEHREGNICLKRWNQMVKHIGDYAKLSFSEQVDVLGKRYSPDCIEAREEFDSKPIVDGKNVEVDDSALDE